MAERITVHRIRLLPGLGGQFLRSVFELVVTVAGIICLDVSLAVPALLAASLAVALPLLVQPLLAERDLRVRNHTGALSRFYLDALLGLVPVRTHGAERALRREHESLLVEWARASFAVQRLVVWVEALQGLTGFGLAAWLMLSHVGHGRDRGVAAAGVLDAQPAGFGGSHKCAPVPISQRNSPPAGADWRLEANVRLRVSRFGCPWT
jgi:ATP-binding cassette subfamily B protein